MEEPKKIVDLDTIPLDKVVSIDMPTAIYIRLNRIIHSMVANKTAAEITDLFKKVGEGIQETDEQFNLYTLIYIQLLIEDKCDKDNIKSKVSFDVDKNEFVNITKNPPAPQSQSQPE